MLRVVWHYVFTNEHGDVYKNYEYNWRKVWNGKEWL